MNPGEIPHGNPGETKKNPGRMRNNTLKYSKEIVAVIFEENPEGMSESLTVESML